tara:strand:- start:158 stop:664 length:507 start_codon:yes stop_codon:yes gene_type:complete
MSKKGNSEEIRVTIPEFKTHVHKSKTKYIKINGQNIYNGRLHPFARAKMVKEMHEYVKPFIDKELKGRDLSLLCPLSICLEVHAPINYGNVRMLKTGLSWKPAKDDFIAKWDADNLWIWGKIFNDTLTEGNHIEDDSVSFITDSGRVKFREVKDLKDRKLVFVISKDC